jgi:hypothetical protein
VAYLAPLGYGVDWIAARCAVVVSPVTVIPALLGYAMIEPMPVLTYAGILEGELVTLP